MSEPRPVKCVSVEDGNGLILRLLPNAAAANRWIRKHFPGKTMRKTAYRTFAAVRRAFDRQMQLGLTDRRTISDLLWYGGVSTKWKRIGAQAKTAA